MTLTELQEKVIEWARAKDLIKPENVQKQLLKFDEESGELSGAILRNGQEKIIDAIGDTLVTLIILAEQLKFKIDMDELFSLSQINFSHSPNLMSNLMRLIVAKGEIPFVSSKGQSRAIKESIILTMSISLFLKLLPAHCLETAYNVIANRKGQTINGTFIKEEDLV